MLPGALEDSKRVVRLVHERFGDAVLLSLMNQYTPVLADAAKAGDARAAATLDRCPELAERVSDDEYELLLDYADELGVEDYFLSLIHISASCSSRSSSTTCVPSSCVWTSTRCSRAPSCSRTSRWCA